MTDSDTAGIPLPEDRESSLRSNLYSQQQQLVQLTQAVMELMAHVRWQASLAHSLQDPPTAAQPTPVNATQASLPERYVENPESCHNFLLTCELYLAEFPELTDKRWIAAVIP